MFTLVLVLTIVALFVIQRYIKYKKYFDIIDKIPGPPAIPIIGNIATFNVAIDKLWNVVRGVNKQYYPLTRYWLGPIPFIAIYHPDDLEVILSGTKHIEKGNVYKFMRPWLKTGLLTSTGGKWQHRRRILTPAFHFNILQKYSDVINENAKTFANGLKEKEQIMTLELVKLCTDRTLHIICESAMGVALDKIDGHSAKEYKNAVSTIGNILIYRAFRPYIQDWMLNSWTEMGRTQNSALKILHKFTDKVLKERKEYHDRTGSKYLIDIEESTDDADSDYLMMGKKKKLAMLDLMIKAEKDGLIDEEGIREELDTFTFAGHDTTGMALVFAIVLLAEHQEIQNKVRAEITNIMHKNKGDLKISEIQELNYLERCIKESLRIFPPVHTVTRFLEEDTCIRGYEIPKGTEVGCFIIDVHKDPNFWPEPTKFDPDRFLPEKIQGRHPFSYIPFSAGPRNCIGQKLAVIELKCVLAYILYNFKLEAVTKSSDIQLLLGVVTRPSTPVYAKFIKIDHQY